MPAPRLPALQLPAERGQSTVEYVGAIVLVCTVLAAVVGFAPDVASSLLDAIRSAVGKVTGGG